MKLSESEKYEEMARLFRLNVVKNLKNTLGGLSIDESLKKDICEAFLSELCVELDQGEWEYSGEFYRPMLCFLSGDNLQYRNESSQLMLPFEAYQFHDKVFDEIDDLYESEEGVGFQK